MLKVALLAALVLFVVVPLASVLLHRGGPVPRPPRTWGRRRVSPREEDRRS